MGPRRLATVGAALLLLVALVAPGAAGASSARLPRDAADWATFSPAQQQAARELAQRQFATALANGTADIDTITSTAADSTAEPLGAAGILATGYASCGFQQNVIGTSRNVRGGGSTTASALMDLIYASKSTKQGQFLRDGALKGNWYKSLTDASYVEAWSGWDHSWTWEHPRYTSNGWHGALDGSVWVVGPLLPCSYSWTP